QGAPELYRANSKHWLDLLEKEHDNLRAVLGWCQNNDITLGLRIIVALHVFWRTRGHALEGLNWAEKFLNINSEVSTTNASLWASAMTVTAWLAYVSGATGLLITWAYQALSFSREAGDTQNVLWALMGLGHGEALIDDENAAERYWQHGLTCAREAKDIRFICIFLIRLGIIARNQQHYGQAIEYH